MTAPGLSVGILAPSTETRNSIARHIEETKMASVTLAVEQYCTVEDDFPTKQFIEVQPEIVLVDMQDQRAAIKALSTLRNALPEARLYAYGVSHDAQLIIETIQAGAREFLSKPISTCCIAKVLSRYLDEKQRLRLDTKCCGKIYCVTSAKGGAGATSVTINIAAILARATEARVAILDLGEPMGDAASYLDLKPRYSLSDAIASAPRLDSILLQTYMVKAGKVSVLAGPKQRKTIRTPNAAALAKLLGVAAATYTHILVDLPTVLDEEVLRTVTDASEEVLLVMTPELPAIWRADRVLAFLSSYSCRERIRLILNRCNIRNEIGEIDIEKALGHQIYWRLPNDYKAISKAIHKGVPLVEQNHSDIAASYRKLVENLTGATPARRRSFLSGLFYR